MATPQHHRLILDTGPPAPLSTETRENGSYSFEANFDTNMVIVLAALLCALIGALGLNSVIRCALRCGHRFAFQSPDEASTRLATTGLKKRVLRKIPVTVYGSEINISATDCPICLGEFMDGEKLRVLPKCNHRFHVCCIDTWLMSHPSCPTCRNSLLERPNTSNAAADVDAGIRQLGNASGEQRDVVVIIDEVS